MAYLSRFYGKLTTGAGKRLKNPTKILNDFANDQVINEFKKSIIKDLSKAKINLNKNKKLNILDIGTGRQALAFQKIYKGNIYHYDINKENVQNLKKIIKRKKLEKNIVSISANIVSYSKMKKNYFDLVYLQGIIQHFSDPSKGVYKILESLKPNGYAWLYFYKSGSFMQFCNYSLRDIFHGSNVVENFSIKHLKLITKIQKKKIDRAKSNLFYFDSFVDSLFVPFAWLFDYKTVKKAFKNSNFKILKEITCSEKEKNYNHDIKHSAFIISLKKKSKKMKIKKKFLSSKYSVNQYNINYSSNKIIKLIKNFKSLKKILEQKKMNKLKLDLEKISICYNIYKKAFKLNHGNFNISKKYNFLNDFLLKQIKYANEL